jgi:MFS family permease
LLEERTAHGVIHTAFAALWVQTYHEQVGIASLHYFALGAGFTLGAQAGARLLDRIYVRLKARNGGVGTPEMRMPMMMFTTLALPIGLLIYGWTAEYKVFWLVPDIGIFIFGVGAIGSFLSIQTYIVDTFTLYAASAIAAVSSFRSLAGFGFPLFANTMFSALGIGWGNSVLALVGLVIGVPAPFLFYRYGEKIRGLSRSARAAKVAVEKTKKTQAQGAGPAVNAEVGGDADNTNEEKREKRGETVGVQPVESDIEKR